MIQVKVRPFLGKSVIVTIRGQSVLYSYDVPVASYETDKKLILIDTRGQSKTTYHHVYTWVARLHEYNKTHGKGQARQQKVYNLEEHIFKYNAADLLL